MHLRSLRPTDLPLIDTFWRKHHSDRYGVPSMNNVIEAKIMEVDDVVVGFGMVKLFAEGIIVLDKDAPLTSRAKGIIVGVEHALDVVKKAGLEQFHIFTDDPHYIEVLRKHWGFRTAPDTVLYREIE